MRPPFFCVRPKSVFCLLALLFLLVRSWPAAAQDLPGQEFTIIALPDTQILSQSHPEIFAAQTRWIVENREALNIRMVLGLGDIVHDAESLPQWQNADAAIRLLDGQVPYALAIGNHDYDNENPSARSAVNFNQFFGKTRYAGYSWYGSSFSEMTNENFWTEFTANGKTYLVLLLEFHPRDAVLEWARGVLAANPAKPAILVTHSFLYSDSTRIDQCDTKDMTAANGNNGELTWEKFVRDSQAEMVLSGHITSNAAARRTDVADGGHLVHQMLSNYQTQELGGAGYLRILRVVPLEGRIEVKTYSPWLNAYKTDPANEFSLPLANDLLALDGGVSGRVRGTDCKSIGGARVGASDTSVTTDAAGYFSFTASAGTHNVEASAAGWKPQSREVDVKPGYSTHADFFLTADNNCEAGPADPSVRICAPADGATVSSPVRVVATAYSSQGVSYTQVYVDGKKVYEVSGAHLDAHIAMADGKRRLTVQARDAGGAIFKQTIFVHVSSQPPPAEQECVLSSQDPSITICQPADGATVASPVRVVARTTSSTPVKYVQVYLDGVKVHEVKGDRVDTTLPMPAGTRRITIQAKNTQQLIKKTIYVTVSP